MEKKEYAERLKELTREWHEVSRKIDDLHKVYLEQQEYRPHDKVVLEFGGEAIKATRCEAYISSIDAHDNGEYIYRSNKVKANGEESTHRLYLNGEPIISMVKLQESPSPLK